jgi:hypothetical protein
LKNPFLIDPWVHIGGLIAIALGAFDIFYGGNKLGATTDTIFIVGGLAAQGVKIINNSALAAATSAANAISNMAVAVAAQQAIDTTTAAAKVTDAAATQAATVKDTATAQAQTIKDVADATATKLAP